MLRSSRRFHKRTLYSVVFGLRSVLKGETRPSLFGSANSFSKTKIVQSHPGAGGKIFVYQSGVLLVGYSYGYFEAKDLLKVGFILTVIESANLVLLVCLYWPLLGIS